MSKSLRSKWRREMRAEKRVKFSEKELQRLKDMLTKAGDYQMVGEQPGAVPESDPASHKIPITSLPRPQRKRSRQRYYDRDEASDTQAGSRKSRLDEFSTDLADVDMGGEDRQDPEHETMAVDEHTRVFSRRTMKDQFGNYPAWMNKRKVSTQKKKNKRIAKNRALSVAGKRVRRTRN